MIARAHLAGNDNYYEDFEVGAINKHARGKSIAPLENVLITNVVMDTAQGHCNEQPLASSPWGTTPSYGGVNVSLVLGLASQDCVENALEELGLNNLRLVKPVIHGDTLYAYTEVLSKKDVDREDAGEVEFRHYGVNQRDELVARVDRRALIKRRTRRGT